MKLTKYDFDCALNLLLQTEKRMPLTFASVGRNSQAEILNKAVMYIGGAGKMTSTELMRLMYRDVDFRTFEAMILHLRQLGVIRVETDTSGISTLEYISAKQDRGMFDLQLQKGEDENGTT
jgi:hypothetical protein